MILRISMACAALALFGCAALVRAAEDETAFQQWVNQEYLPGLGRRMTAEVTASWNYETNLTDFNEGIYVAASSASASYTQTMSREMKPRFSQTVFNQEKNRRLYRKIGMIGDAMLPANEYEELVSLKNKMTSTYSTAVVCADPELNLESCPEEQRLTLEPGITRLFDDPETTDAVLAHLWTEWREQSGKTMRQDYMTYVGLKNKAADLNGFNNNAEMWRSPYVEPDFNYTDADFVKEAKALYQQARPLYEQLHAYVRAKLIEKFGPLRSSETGPIPAHLLGNMWAQSWLGTLKFTQIYPYKEPLDVTQTMKAQGWDALKMFQTSDKFFEDLGLIKMPQKFWDHSMLTKPEGRNVTCHASAWDFYNGEDFSLQSSSRIKQANLVDLVQEKIFRFLYSGTTLMVKQCTDVTMQDLFTVHHEMGHVEYFLQYKEQPITFRDGANDGFHEAIGDVLALSVSTPGHLRKIGLLPSDSVTDRETNLNFQMSTALEKIAFLPFGLMLDLYRYDVFAGKINETNLNSKWWEYVTEYQGICAPTAVRGEEYFDPGAKFHVPADVPYMRYFVSFIVQFQFHKALCEKAGHTGPLYECDIDSNKEAGKLLGDALKLGSSRPWQHVMQVLTNQTRMDAQPLLDFFQPLSDFLVEENRRMGYPVGWNNNPFCPLNDFEDYVYNDLNPRAQEIIYNASEASWSYNTDINPQTQAEMIAAAERSAQFDKDTAREIRDRFGATVPVNGTTHEKRLYDKLTKLGDAGLDAGNFTLLQNIGTKMSQIYSTAKVCRNVTITNVTECPTADLMPLEGSPGQLGITEVMSTSRDAELLKHVWWQWRNETGRKMRADYMEYTKLKNQAAKLDGYVDNSQAWKAPFVEPAKGYNEEVFMMNVNDAWESLKPVYMELHAYVRHKLIQQYPSAKIDPEGPIPAHLLGNMWAQTWGGVQNFSQLYEKEPLDVTDAMVEQGYDARRMFETSDKFFSDLGLEKMPERFWNKSMLTKPEGREVTCHASAWDFYNQKDFRIKQCTAVTMDDFITVHHEMGHVEYYLQYKHLPVPFRRGANDGFHEAVGDVLSLSVSTPKHLQKIGLLSSETSTDDPELDLNFMYSTALEKIAFLPFGLLMDLYRYDLFSGKINETNLNSEWWRYRTQYQGVCSPVPRTEEDFDAGAKYHIPADVPYMRYFVSFIIQFQFHKSLCDVAGHQGPLYKCDIDGSKAAGKLLGDALRLGSSKPWQDAMRVITGQEQMDSEALKTFFEPLRLKLRELNSAAGAVAGWSMDTVCVPSDHSTPNPIESSTASATSSSSIQTVSPAASSSSVPESATSSTSQSSTLHSTSQSTKSPSTSQSTLPSSTSPSTVSPSTSQSTVSSSTVSSSTSQSTTPSTLPTASSQATTTKDSTRRTPPAVESTSSQSPSSSAYTESTATKPTSTARLTPPATPPGSPTSTKGVDKSSASSVAVSVGLALWSLVLFAVCATL